MQWLPYKWTYQFLYLVYRWILALYFFAWLITSWVESDGPKYLIFLTNWSFITYCLHVIVAAISSTTKYVFAHFLFSTEEEPFSRANDYSLERPQGCCGYKSNDVSWYQMIHWLLFTLATDLAVGVMILYWTLLYETGRPIDGINANTHLVNGLIALVEIWVSGVPVNFLHFIYPAIFGIVYAIFSGVYFGISGDIIYPVIDYENKPGSAVGTVLGVLFVFLPLVHVLFYLQHIAKFWILYYIFGRKERSQTLTELTEERENDA